MVQTIYDKTGYAKAEIAPDDSSTQVKEVQGDNILTLSFTHYANIALDVNDYTDFEGERYWLMEKYAPKQNNETEWVYDLKLYGIESIIKRFLVLETTDGNTEPVFTLTAPPYDHVNMIVKCINNGLNHTTDWKVGQVDGTDNIVIDYEGKYCDEALKEIAEKVGGKAEWWIEGQTVNICRCEHGEELAIGYGNGLTELERDTSNTAKFYTRLFPIGSARNIDPEKYGHNRLMLPGGLKYIELHTEEYGIYDHYEQDAFSDIYPRRLGLVSSVRSETKTDDDGNPFIIYYFKDDTLNFDPNEYELANKVKRVSFQDGELAGLGTDDAHYFEVNFNSKTHEFEIITIWPYDDDTQLPGGNLIPQKGDHYILWNIRMPDEYYTLAEEEFRVAVEQYNAEHWQDISIYKGPTDHVWVEQNDVDLFVGRRVRLESEKFFPDTGYRNSRITKITKKVVLPSQVDLEISDALQSGALQQVSDSLENIKSYTRERTSGRLPDIIRTWDNTLPTDTNLFSARRSQKEFISKNKVDRAKKKIIFDEGIDLGDFTEGLTGGHLDGKGNAVLMDVVVDRIHDKASTPAERVLVGAQGFDMYVGEDGKAHMYIDYLSVRNKAFFSALGLRKVDYSGGTLLLSNAGSTIVKVVYIFDESGENVIAYKCYAKADDGTTATNNLWRVGMMALCQTFNVKAGVYKDISNRYYWRLCIGAGQETLSDGKLYDWVILSNVKEFKGSDSIIPGYMLRILANESKYLCWGGILVAVNNREDNTSIAQLYELQYGDNKDEDGTLITDRLFYGYEPVEGGEPDAPCSGDVIVNAGDQIKWNSYGNVIKMTTSTEENGTKNAPAVWMYQGIGAPRTTEDNVINVWQWKHVSGLYSPLGTRVNSDYFKFYTGDDPYNEFDPWADVLDKAKGYTSSEITMTKQQITAITSKINFTQDDDGNWIIDNINKSGLVTEDNYSKMFSEKVDKDGNIVAVASIKTSIVTTDGAKGTTSIGQVEINGDKVKINANHKLNIDGDYIIIKTKNFSVDEAGNVTVTGTISAAHGKVAGFTIDGNNLSNTPFDNDASVIFRNDTYDTFAGIGGNVLPASSGLRAVARFENHDTRNQWGFGKNIAMIASAKNSDYNYAMLATGNMVINNGYVSSYTLNKFTISQDGIIFSDGTPVKKGNVWLVNSTANNGGISLPTLDEVRLHLGISNTTPFALKYSVVADLNANGFLVYGRNQKQDTKGGTPWNVAKLPNIIYHDGQHLDEIRMEMGDSVVFLLVYDPDNGSKDGYDCKYTARVINRQFE